MVEYETLADQGLVQMLPTHPNHMFGYTKSVQHPPLLPDPTHNHVLISWQLWSSFHPSAQDIQLQVWWLLDCSSTCDLGCYGEKWTCVQPYTQTWYLLLPVQAFTSLLQQFKTISLIKPIRDIVLIHYYSKLYLVKLFLTVYQTWGCLGYGAYPSYYSTKSWVHLNQSSDWCITNPTQLQIHSQLIVSKVH